MPRPRSMTSWSLIALVSVLGIALVGQHYSKAKTGNESNEADQSRPLQPPTHASVLDSWLAVFKAFSLSFPSLQVTPLTTTQDEQRNVMLSAGNLTIGDANDGTSNDNITISFRSPNIVISDPGNGRSVNVAMSNVRAINVNTLDGNDTLTLDLSGGSVLPAGGLSYEGGPGFDTIAIKGSGKEVVNYRPSATTFGDGVVTVDNQVINFSGLEPFDIDSVQNFILTFPGGNDVASIDNGTNGTGNPVIVVSGTSAGVGFESGRISNCTNVTVDTVAFGSDGNDTITINSANNAHGNINLSLITGTGSDQVTISGPMSFGGNVSITSQAIASSALITAGASNTVSLNAGSGAITDGNGASNNISAQNLNASAGTGITLDTSVANITANTSAPGSISIREADAVTLTNVVAANGPITITTSGNTSITNVTSGNDSDANDISIIATTGDVTVATVTGGAGAAADVTIQATAGNIFDEGSNATNITADVLTLNAFRAVGQSGATAQIDTAANSLSTSTTGPGPFVGAPTPGIWTGDTNALMITTATTQDGVILIDGAGALTVGTVNAGGTGQNVRLLTTSGGINFGATGSVSAPGDIVALECEFGGAITESTTATKVTALSLSARPGLSIGTTGDPLNTNVTNFAASSVTGSVFVANSGPLTITSVTAFGRLTNGLFATSGSASVATSGSMTVASLVRSLSSLSLTAGDTAAAGDNLTVNSNVIIESTNSTIAFNAGDNVDLSAANIRLNSGSGITINGDANDADPGSGSTVTLAADVNASGVLVVNGNGDSDTFNVTPDSLNTISSIQINGGNPTTAPGDALNYNGPPSFTRSSNGPGAGSITAVNVGNVFFTGIESDGFSPKVSSTTPVQGATGVATDTNITINFNESVNIKSGGFTLDCGGTQTFTPALPVNGVTTIAIDPVANNLPANTLCAVTGVWPHITDLAGNPLDGDGNGTGGDFFTLTFTTKPALLVTNANDAGVGSLRQAVLDANASPGGDTINFDPVFFSTLRTITLAAGEMTINEAVNIVGPGASLLTVSGNNFSRIFRVGFGVTGVSISGLTIANGKAGDVGGGIVSDGDLALTSCVITNNSSAPNFAGGGVYQAGGVGTFTSCTFTGNTAGGGGGLEIINASATITNCTISGNTATLNSAGVELQSIGGGSSKTLTISNSTIVNNVSPGASGLRVTSGGGVSASAILQSTIIANNGTNLGTVGGATATITSLGTNLSDNWNGVTTLGTDITAQPLLAPLTMNGGQTATHALLFGSPALDAGNNSGVSTDQRGAGFSRTVDLPLANGAGDGTDIGAYEAQSAPPQQTTHLSITAPANVSSGVAFNFTVFALDANEDVVSGYRGTVHFTSSDIAGGTALPADYTFTAGDSGMHTFSATLATAGSQSITGTDTLTSSISGSKSINVGGAPAVVQFSASNYTVQEDCTFVTVTVNRIGNTSGVSSVNYSTSDVTATERRDYITALGSLTFAAGETSKTFVVLINEDSYVEGSETLNVSLTNPSGATLGTSVAAVSITDDASEPATNVIDDPGNYVCQQYHDFLNRQPDPSGLAFWTSEITTCGADTNCIEVKRINVSAAFFLSIEFQGTGYLVERLYKTAYGDAVGNSTFPNAHPLPVPVVRFNEFLSDAQKIGQGVIVGQGNWEQQLENNKQAFVAEFVQRSRFTTAFPQSMTATQFVDTLNLNAGNPLTPDERTILITGLGSAFTRAQVLRTIAEHNALNASETNKAFVLMQYLGYLRRNPNDPQDTDHTGYDFWLTKLNQFNGNFVNAEMVKAFILSAEYRQRFGP